MALLAANTAASPIIPAPASFEPGSCRFQLDARTAIAADESLAGVASYLRAKLEPPTGFLFPSSGAAGKAIELRAEAGLGAEGYRLEIAEDGVAITASEPAGAFYAVQSLLQLLPADVFRRAPAGRTDWPAPCAKIEDAPRFSWRGLLLDVGRHFIPKEDVLRLFDLMALYKLNTFHWHLTDDTGWRIEIKGRPGLAALGSSGDFSSMNPSDATRSPSERAGGFYTQDDVREIVAYAAERAITVVPSIEMPGHAGAACLVHPELCNRRQIEEAGGDASFLGSQENVFNVEDATIGFLKSVLDEVLALFPGQFIHIGGDEVWKEPWKRNPRAQARMKELGLKTEEELQSWFIKQLDAYLVSKGRRLIGWDEILEGGLAPNAAVTSWRGVEGGIAAARAGHDVVMNPRERTYLDYYQSRPSALEPRAIGEYLPLEEIYKFEPIPKELTPEEAKRVLGGQAAVWTEYIPSMKQVEYMAFPRLPAFAETVWSDPKSRDFPDFMARLEAHLPKLDRLGVGYRPLRPEPAPAARWTPAEAGADWAVRDWDVTPAVTVAGDYKVLFDYSGDENKPRVEWIELLEDGRSVQRVERPHRPGGGNDKDNLFIATLRPRRAPSIRCGRGSAPRTAARRAARSTSRRLSLRRARRRGSGRRKARGPSSGGACAGR